MTIRLLIAGALLAAFALGGCAPSEADLKREVSIEEATNSLNEVVAATVSSDVQVLSDRFGCSVAMAEQHLEQAGGWGARPKNSPTIVDSYVLPAERLKGGSFALGGRILVLEGENGFGQSYRSEFFVSWDLYAKKLLVQYPIYWLP